jgi:uncharacterized protein
MQFERDRPYHGHDPQDKDAFQVPECIPVFPLPNAVFFPKTYLPLHIFEPRYREMVADAAAEGQCIGMALLKEGWEEHYDRNPSIYQIGCVGRVVNIQSLVDGRSNILLQGIDRYQIREEVGGKSYRRATIDLNTQDTSSGLDRTLREGLIGIFQESLTSQEDLAVWQRLFPLDRNDEVLVNALSSYLDFTPLEKQFLLEADSLQQQAHRLYDLVQFKRHEPNGARGWG